MRRPAKLLVLVSLLLFSISGLVPRAEGSLPQRISYQARLTQKDGTPLSGTDHTLTFSIYDAAGQLQWTETYSPQSHPLNIEDGVFSVTLGAVNPMENLAFDEPYYLSVTVDGEVMQEREEITSAAYALRAKDAETTEKLKADTTDPSPGYLSEKVDTTSIEVNASHKLQIKNQGVTAEKMALGAAWRHVGREVFNQPSPTAFREIDLSNYVGKNRALVFLKVKVTGDGHTFAFKTKGDEDVVIESNEARGTSFGVIQRNSIIYILVETDDYGVIEFRSELPTHTIITLLGYIR